MGGSSSQYLSESEISDDDLDYLDSKYFMHSVGNEAIGREFENHLESPPLNKAAVATLKVLGSTPLFIEAGKSSTDDSVETSDNSVDAVMRPPLIRPERLISSQDLSSIEKQLDEYELVSLLYLLYDDSSLALQAIEEYITSNASKGRLDKWAHLENRIGKKWQKKLIEALCIIQNYQILKKFGYNKDDLQHEYLPSQTETSCAIKKLRKVLYLIAEKLGSDQTRTLICNMKEIIGNTILFRNYNPDYLELYFLHWEQSNVNIRDIQRALKMMDMELLCDYLESCISCDNPVVPLKDVYSSEFTPQQESERKTITTKDNTYLQTGTFENLSYEQRPGTSGLYIADSDRYEIDPVNPGIVLIINQEAFYTEHDEQYKHLLHEYKDEMQLTDRTGTGRDKDRLKTLFSKMNFKVIVKQNLAHYGMIKLIEETVDMVKEESSLIICILSHGDNGVVYGANSCKVEVSRIQHIMCKRNKKLVGKPKLLILQSCQGKRCQKIEEDDDENNVTDGGTRVPATADLLTFWATIPGFAAIRNMSSGTWFIQALCDEIEESNSKVHFLDICTRIVNKVTRKKWREESGVNVMTPMVVHTLTKSFFLPPLSE